MKFTKQTASELPDPSRPSIQSHVSRYIENIHPKWSDKTIWKDVILERIDPFFNHPFFRGHFRSFHESRATYLEIQPLSCYATQLQGWLYSWPAVCGFVISTAASVRRWKTQTTKCWLAMGYDGYTSVPRNLQKQLHFWEPRILPSDSGFSHLKHRLSGQITIVH